MTTVHQEQSEKHKAALSAAKAGRAVFPGQPRGKLPLFPKAHPDNEQLQRECKGKCGAVGHGFYDATTDLDRINGWWNLNPEANVLIRTGATSGIVVLEVDPRNDGTESLGKMLEQYGGSWLSNPTVRSGGGGQHYYFKHPGGYVKSNSGGLGPGLDIKGDLAYVVAPPSVHDNGKPYAKGGGKVGTLPAELAARITKQEQPENGGSAGLGPAIDWRLVIADGIKQGQRDETLFKYAASLRRRYPDMPPEEARLLVAGMWTRAEQAPGDAFLLQDALAKVDQVWAAYPPGAPVPDNGDVWEPQADDDGDVAVQRELERLRVHARAREQLAQEQALATFTMAPGYSDLERELDQPDLAIRYTVVDLHPEGSNTLLGAEFKAGKTTLLLNLLKALMDDEPFLGKYITMPAAGRIAFWNYELTEHQFRNWLRKLEPKRAGRGTALHLRGRRMPLNVPEVQAIAVDWLKQHEITTWLLDPWARVYGGDENSNEQVARVLEALDVIKEQAGVRDLWLSAHFGRMQHDAGAEHVRGATRLDDWADVRWLLTKDDDDNRYFRATGRDVEVTEQQLAFEEEHNALRVAAGAMSRRQTREQRGVEEVARLVRLNPGMNTRELRAIMRNVRGKHQQEAITAAAQAGLIVRKDGANGSILHYPQG